MLFRLSLIPLLLLPIVSFSQVEFEKGYFINNQNQRKECYIKNIDWKNNPTEFLFREHDSKTIVRANIDSVKEFGVYGFSHYVRASVGIDRSPNELSSLTTNRTPVWSKETQFLKVLLSGKASLYYFEDSRVSRFFYSVSDTSIKQLVYKMFKVGSTVYFNNDFRQQIFSDMQCPNLGSVNHIRYTEADLKSVFIRYNKCFGIEVPESGIKKTFFTLKITPGLNAPLITVDNSLTNSQDVSFGRAITYRLGAEAEFTFPFNRGKWAFVVESVYQDINLTAELSSSNANLRLQSIEFPLGLRYYSFLNNHLKFFVNGFYTSAIAINLNSNLTYTASPNYAEVLELVPSGSFAVGGGFDFDRVSAELRYIRTADLFSTYVYWSSDYDRWCLILGYKFIKRKT
ncbi:MAG: hypothetical protein ACK5DD_00970 [Cyclobacteriaceae bacterium]|jgi:hypothetical protein